MEIIRIKEKEGRGIEAKKIGRIIEEATRVIET